MFLDVGLGRSILLFARCSTFSLRIEEEKLAWIVLTELVVFNSGKLPLGEWDGAPARQLGSAFRLSHRQERLDTISLEDRRRGSRRKVEL